MFVTILILWFVRQQKYGQASYVDHHAYGRSPIRIQATDDAQASVGGGSERGISRREDNYGRLGTSPSPSTESPS